MQFRGCEAHPIEEVELSTAPPSSTHWGQQVFLADEPALVEEDDVISGSLVMTRQASNHRLLFVALTYAISRGDAVVVAERTIKFRID